MKNSLQLLALGLVLFLGACSNGEPNGDKDTVTSPTIETKFLDKVKGKKFVNTGTIIIERGEFSEDGRSLDISYKFVEASDENTGKYQANLDINSDGIPVMVTSTIKITGAKTLTITYTWPGQADGTDTPMSFNFSN